MPRLSNERLIERAIDRGRHVLLTLTQVEAMQNPPEMAALVSDTSARARWLLETLERAQVQFRETVESGPPPHGSGRSVAAPSPPTAEQPQQSSRHDDPSRSVRSTSGACGPHRPMPQEADSAPGALDEVGRRERQSCSPPRRPRTPNVERNETEVTATIVSRAEESAVRGLLTVTQVAQLMQIPTSSVYALVRRNRLPYCRIGKHIRFDPALLAAWIAAGGEGTD